MKRVVLLFLCVLLVISAGCVGEVPLTQEQATFHIASLGEQNASFTLWVGEPGCCKEIYFYEKQADGAMIIRSVDERQSRFYFDSTPDDARVVFMKPGGDGYISCNEMDTIYRCINSKSFNHAISFHFHVPPGTVIRPYGSPGDSGDDHDSGDTVRTYAVTRMIASGGQRII
jgi:hypothetical protein